MKAPLAPGSRVLAALRQEDHPARIALVILALYLFSRLGLIAVGMLTRQTLGDGVAEPLLNLFCRWDCDWYLQVQERGYSMASLENGPGMTNYSFFPLLPLLARGVGTLGLEALPALLLTTNLCFIAALFYVQRYAVMVGLSLQASLIAVALLCFTPQSYVFSAGITESLFLLLLVMAMYHLRRRQYLVSGLAGALLSAARPNGFFFLLFALAWLVQEFGPRVFLQPWRRPEAFVPVVLAPLGLLLFWAWCFYATGDAFAQQTTIRQGWGWAADLPWRVMANHLQQGGPSRFWAICSLVAALVSLGLLRLRLYAEFVLCAGLFGLFWISLISNAMLRYCIVLFPLWLVLAHALDRRPLATAATLATFGLLGGWLMVAWTLGAYVSL